MKNKNYVFDSSVYAKLLLPEKDSGQVEELFNKIINQDSYILVPTIFLYEVIGVFKKYNYEKKIIEGFITNYYSNKPYIKIFDLDEKIISKALEISKSGSKKVGFPSFYDASYHALAILYDCDFITADRKYYEKVKELGHIQLLANIKND